MRPFPSLPSACTMLCDQLRQHVRSVQEIPSHDHMVTFRSNMYTYMHMNYIPARFSVVHSTHKHTHEYAYKTCMKSTTNSNTAFICLKLGCTSMFYMIVHIGCAWYEQAVLQKREKGTVQSHLQHNVVHEPLQHCVYPWYTPQPTHTITAHTYCTPHCTHTTTDRHCTYVCIHGHMDTHSPISQV